MHLALADIDEAGLAETARRASDGAPSGRRISRHRLDVADRDAIGALPAIIRATHKGLDILINNAGVAVGGTFEEIAEDDFDWLFSINFFGVVRMTRAFLPMLRESDDARIVNISSLFGLIATPGQTAYTASKYAVRGFSESLRHELAASHVGITTVHPGGVATAIAKNARAPKGAPPEETERQKRAFAALLKLPPERPLWRSSGPSSDDACALSSATMRKSPRRSNACCRSGIGMCCGGSAVGLSAVEIRCDTKRHDDECGAGGALEHFDVIIVGAGLSGIGAAHHLQASLPRKSFTILESRDAIGGTWDLFRYPGVRSDSDMFTLGYAFRALARRKRDRRWRVDPNLHPRDRSIRWARSEDPVRPQATHRLMVVANRALGARDRAR